VIKYVKEAFAETGIRAAFPVIQLNKGEHIAHDIKANSFLWA